MATRAPDDGPVNLILPELVRSYTSNAVVATLSLTGLVQLTLK